MPANYIASPKLFLNEYEEAYQEENGKPWVCAETLFYEYFFPPKEPVEPERDTVLGWDNELSYLPHGIQILAFKGPANDRYRFKPVPPTNYTDPYLILPDTPTVGLKSRRYETAYVYTALYVFLKGCYNKGYRHLGVEILNYHHCGENEKYDLVHADVSIDLDLDVECTVCKRSEIGHNTHFYRVDDLLDCTPGITLDDALEILGFGKYRKQLKVLKNA